MTRISVPHIQKHMCGLGAARRSQDPEVPGSIPGEPGSGADSVNFWVWGSIPADGGFAV